MVDEVATKNRSITIYDLTRVVHDDDLGGETGSFLYRINIWI